MRNFISPWILPLMTCAALVAGAPLVQQRSQPSRQDPAGQLPTGTVGEATLAPLLAKATPAVVSIGVSGRMEVDPFFLNFHSRPSSRGTQAAGSGVIVDAAKGYILTNHHLVQNAERIQVSLQDGRNVDAELVGEDANSDVAVIHVSADKLTSLPLGNSDELRVGDFVVAIGNPFGLSQTATHGIVSALGRSGLNIGGRDSYEDYIQTDASINPGNSGGALVNMRGELIGINAAIVGPTGGNVGIGFAIPINMAQQIVRQLVDHGEVHRGQLGVYLEDLSPELVRKAKASVEHGAYISQVVHGSAADEAGLEAGDIVISIDGVPVRSGADMRNKIGVRQAGDTIKIEFLRDGRRKTVSAQIRAKLVRHLIHSVERPAVATPDDPRGAATERV